MIRAETKIRALSIISNVKQKSSDFRITTIINKK